MIGLILAAVAVFLAVETRALLVGEAITDELGLKIRRICVEDEAVERVVRSLGVHLGPDEIFLTLGLKFRPAYGVQEAARAVERIEKKIRSEDPRVTRVFVEPETVQDPGGLGTPF